MAWLKANSISGDGSKRIFGQMRFRFDAQKWHPTGDRLYWLLVPVGDVSADEAPRRDTSLEKLAALKPVFDPEGTTTAGNAPGVNDGASCVLVASEEWARRRGIAGL